MLRSAKRTSASDAWPGPTSGTGGEGEGAGAPVASRQAAAAGLRLELLPTSIASDGRAAWHVAAGLAAALVRPTAHGDLSVDPEDLVSWGLARDEAFHLASAGVRAASLPTVTVHAPTGGAELLLVSGTGTEVSAHVLWLDDLVGSMTEAGALVAVPHRRAVLAHRLTRRDHAVEAVNLLLLMADGAHAQGPDPVSADLYWWRDGWLTSLRGVVDGDDVHVDPPSEFLDVLDGLPGI